MQTDLRGRDLIGDLDFSREEVETVLEVAFDLKRKRALGEAHAALRDKTLAMLFFFSSTRTRGSFEAGMAQLGGHAAFIESKTTQIAHGDTPKEIGQIFGRYFDGIAIRHVDWGVGNTYINDVARHSRVPVLNMQCEIYHPFQILADLMTILEKKGRDLKRKKMAVSWAYAASYQKPISVPQSLVLQLPRFGLDLVLAHPPEFKLMPEVMDQAREQARRYGTGFEVVNDMDLAFQDADIIYAKSWGAMLTTTDQEEGARIIHKYSSWITDERRMQLARPDAIYMHPLPADRNVEVTDAVLDGPQSVVYDEAENRLHAQKAVMALTMR
jgi:N-acetylornithine carbamoyltransferase